MEPRFSVRVSSTPTGSGATAYVRKRRLEIGLPITFDQEYPEVSALEMLLAAVASDVVVGLVDLAKKRRVALDHVEAVAEGELDNPLATLGVIGEEGHPGLVALSVKVYVDTLADGATVRRVWDEALARSPMMHTFRSSVRLEVTLQLV